MNDDSLNKLLSNAQSNPDELTAKLTSALEQASETARRHVATEPRVAETRKPLWKRPTLIFAVGVASVLAVTGASAITMQSNIDADAIVRIEYQTDTGKAISCLYSLGAATETGADIRAAKAWVARHDWSGVGQTAYDDALAHPYKPGPNDNIETTPEILDQISLQHAVLDTITAQIPGAFVGAGGTFFGGTSNCKWEMH
jgi:hypothetical protein